MTAISHCPKQKPVRLLIAVNIPEFFLSHRLPVALGARDAGYEVHVATAPGACVADITAAGLAHHALPLSRSGIHPLREAGTAIALYRLMQRLRPDVVHLVTIKPVLYGGIMARIAGVSSVVAAVSGLGFVFTRKGIRATVVRWIVGRLYRLALGKKQLRVIFQNPEDRDALTRRQAEIAGKSVMIRGSGVDLSACRFTPEPGGVPVVTFAARLLRDKGVQEFVDAARMLGEWGVKARFRLVGDPDPDNPRSVTREDLNEWRHVDGLEILGFRKDIPEVFSASNLVVLPSYYGEGLPKVLVEAAACGRAVITTDHPGCRDAIEPDRTGLLVPVRDARALAMAIRRLLEDTTLRHRMGRAGRELAEREFGIDGVVKAHLALYRDLERCAG